MRRTLSTLVVLGAAVTACSGVGSRAATGSPPPSGPPTTTVPTTTPTGSVGALRRTRTVTSTSPATLGAAGTAATHRPARAGVATTRPSAAVQRTTTAAPTHTKPPSSSCAGVAGSTTTIQETAGNRFSPARVTVGRCDFVQAVHADTTGAPHTWQGKTWSSGDMSGTSNSTYTYRFTSAGTFDFFCAYHRSLGMVGSVTVR